MKHLKLFFALFAMLALGVGNAWGADSGITASDGVFVIDFYNSDKLTSTSGTDLSTTNYSNFVKVASGLTNSNVVTSIAKDGTVQYNKNGGLTIGSSKANAHYVTFNIGSDYAVNKITVYATEYESGRLLLNGKAADSGKLGTKGCQFSKVTQPLVWDNLNGATTLKFTKDNGSGSTQKRLTIYTIVCEYTISGGTEEPVVSLTVDPTTIDFGTVYEDATVADKTVAVNFANLTGAVTYSGLSTPFSATGAISATGDKITISADASTIGEYSQTLTVASTADSKTAEVTVTMNVVEKPAPTGTFTLHTGALVEGDYVIVSTNSLKAEVNSDRLASLPVTISNDEIVDPDATTIWHIAKSGEYWTLYNANKAKYAASTGAKNKAALLDDGSDDKALWSVTGTSTYEFVNKKNAASALNANLRYNKDNAENSRWACYSTSTGAALSLYRKAGTKYNVTVSSTTNGSVTVSPTSAEAGATIALTVTPDAGYVLDALTVTDASSNTIEVADNEFKMPASDVTVTATFKENEKPAATLTLSKNGVTEDITGNKQDDVVTLPTTVETDCVKQFVGWSADANCATEPEYAPGASYTLASTSQTLYAVYATVEGGETTVSVDMETYATDNSWGSSSSTNQKEININSDLKAVISEGVNSGKYYNDGVRIYQTEGATVTVSTTAGELKSVKFTFTIANNGTLLHEGVAMTSDEAVEVSGTSAVFSVGDTHATENKGQVRFTAIEVVYTGGATYSNYSTTCSAALANPTFSLEEGKYTETKSVEITATEGTIYYTTDGTTPTSSSTQYTGAIALNDCGEYTIKAIAISSDSQSDVVSATYTIKLPLTNSQAAPYTEAEAIAVYDGGCYDNQDVYVKGTVKTATFNSTYGNYTITLTNGFQFYRFLQAAETKFTEDIIVPGDVLVACGKLSKYNTTYQLAEGCYLVERIPYEGEKTDISNTEATAYTVDKAFELIADVSSDLTKEVFVKGLVAVAPTSNPTDAGKMTYSISDNGENTGNVLKVYLGLGINGAAFTSKDDVKLGDYVVVKGKLLDYSGTYELTDNQLVTITPAATITIADITMEVGETKTIAPTITPAGAAVTYAIKAGSDNCITLNGAEITATEAGTATIVATIAETADYMGATKEITVIVKAPEQALTDWVLTSLSDITINDLVVITMTKEEKTWAMTNDKGTTEAPVASPVTLSANALAAEPDENLKWVVSNDNGTLTIYPYGGYETWLYCTNTNNGVRVGTGEAKEFTIDTDHLYTTLTNDPRYLGVYDADTDTDTWRCYTSINSNIEDQTLAFYVKKNANDVLPGTGEEPGDDPVVPTPTINPTATFIFNTADGLTNLGITYPATEDEDNAGSYKTEFENNATFTQDGITMTTTGGTTVATRVWLTAAGKLDLRVYKGATLTFSVPAEHQISKVVFDGSNIGHLLVNETAVSGNAWTGSAQTITFTAKSDASTIKINTIAFVVEYTRNVTNKYGSICLPYASASTSGAYFYEVVGKGTENSKDAVYLASVNTLKAGVPYIFEKTANTIKVVYSSEKEDTPQNANGLMGTFEETTVPAGDYILYNDAFRTNEPAGSLNKIRAYRAYLDMDNVTGGAPQQMPGRRYIGMDVHGENGTTGLDNIMTTDAPVKAIENGQLIIIRNGEKYNVQGVRL